MNFQGRVFWIKDHILEVVLAFLYVHMLRMEVGSEWVEKWKDVVKNNSLGYFSGFIDLHFDDLIVNPEIKVELREIIDGAKMDVMKIPEDFDMATLNNVLLLKACTLSLQGRLISF